MRHRVHGRKLGRTSAHRKALFRNQLTALFTHERIITTVAKAKELRPIAERMVTVARTGTLAARRRVATMVSDKEVAKRLFDEIIASRQPSFEFIEEYDCGILVDNEDEFIKAIDSIRGQGPGNRFRRTFRRGGHP